MSNDDILCLTRAHAYKRKLEGTVQSAETFKY